MSEAEWLDLANEVIIQAARDFRISKKRVQRLTEAMESLERRMKKALTEAREMPESLAKREKYRLAAALEDRAADAAAEIKQEKAVMRTIEKFFHSDWADILSRMDASAIIEKIKEEEDDVEDEV